MKKDLNKKLSEKTKKKIEVAKKYKINEKVTRSPYMRIEYLSGGRREVVEFSGDGQIHGCDWSDSVVKENRSVSKIKWFFAGILYTGVILGVVYLVWKLI